MHHLSEKVKMSQSLRAVGIVSPLVSLPIFSPHLWFPCLYLLYFSPCPCGCGFLVTGSSPGTAVHHLLITMQYIFSGSPLITSKLFLPVPILIPWGFSSSCVYVTSKCVFLCLRFAACLSACSVARQGRHMTNWAVFNFILLLNIDLGRHKI